MYFGLHFGVSGGYEKTIDYAKTMGCTSMQIFSGNPKTYRVGVMDVPALERFAALRQEAGIVTSAIHTSYLINLATEDPKISHGSLRLLENDLAVAATGKIDFVNTHLGSYGTRPRPQGFAAVVSLLEKALENIKPGVYLVLENSAGAGQLCGGTLEELGEIVRAVDHPQLAICLSMRSSSLPRRRSRSSASKCSILTIRRCRLAHTKIGIGTSARGSSASGDSAPSQRIRIFTARPRSWKPRVKKPTTHATCRRSA